MAKDNLVRHGSESNIERLQEHGVAFVYHPLGRRERGEVELAIRLSGLEWHVDLFRKATTISRVRVLIGADNQERFIDRSIPEVPGRVSVIRPNAIVALEPVHPEAKGIRFGYETGVADG